MNLSLDTDTGFNLTYSPRYRIEHAPSCSMSMFMSMSMAGQRPATFHPSLGPLDLRVVLHINMVYKCMHQPTPSHHPISRARLRTYVYSAVQYSAVRSITCPNNYVIGQNTKYRVQYTLRQPPFSPKTSLLSTKLDSTQLR